MSGRVDKLSRAATERVEWQAEPDFYDRLVAALERMDDRAAAVERERERRP